MERRGEKMPQSNEYMLKQDDAELIYQKKLTAGTNITIDPVTNTISSTGGGGSSVSYAGSLPQGYGDTIGIITIDGTQYPIKVRNLIQGSNINIVQDMATGNLTISSTAQGTHVEPNPSGTPTNTLDTIGINGTIYEIEGGGSGNVADVYVNGTSVLDENDIAQVFSHQEITEISYDNLPSTKFSDNHMYLIKEAGTPPTGEYYNPVIYSTEEREVGVWIDNKPLYQKSVMCGSITNRSTISLGIENVEHISFVPEGSWINDGDRPLPYVIGSDASNNIGGYFTIGTSDTSFEVRMGNGSASDSRNGVITVQYTKTTDVAGSGAYTTLGVPAVHYTTDEQVIGTWIDGKPLYQKTVDTGVLPNSTLKTVAHNISDISKIVKYEGMALDSTGADVRIMPYVGFNNWSIGLYVDATNINIQTMQNWASDYPNSHVTIQYTKTTD